LPIFFAVGGIPMTAVDVVMLLVERSTGRLRAWLRQEGREVWAPARVEIDASLKLNGRHPHVVHAEWRDERTGRTHTAKSEHLPDDPSPRLTGRTHVRVLYDPSDPDRNMVDLDAVR
jgi:hypothetical protein